MQVNAKVGVHNEFLLVSEDINTGDKKEVGRAYNIVLNNAYTRLSQRYTFHSCMQIGKGTGELNPSRNQLFSYSAGYNTTVDEISQKLPVSYVRVKVVLSPETLANQLITEVGLSWTTNNSDLCTHAMIEDSEGNPISVTKSPTEILTIYATIYFELFTESAEYGSSFEWFEPAYNNGLVKWFTESQDLLYYSLYGLSSSSAIKATPWSDVAFNTSYPSVTSIPSQRKIKFNNFRFSVSHGKGTIKSLVVLRKESPNIGIFKLKLPHPLVAQNRLFSDVKLGVGDGVRTEFSIPKEVYDIVDGTLSILKSGVPVTSSDADINELKDRIEILSLPSVKSVTNWSTGSSYNSWGYVQGGGFMPFEHNGFYYLLQMTCGYGYNNSGDNSYFGIHKLTWYGDSQNMADFDIKSEMVSSIDGLRTDKAGTLNVQAILVGTRLNYVWLWKYSNVGSQTPVYFERFLIDKSGVEPALVRTGDTLPLITNVGNISNYFKGMLCIEGVGDIDWVLINNSSSSPFLRICKVNALTGEIISVDDTTYSHPSNWGHKWAHFNRIKGTDKLVSFAIKCSGDYDCKPYITVHEFNKVLGTLTLLSETLLNTVIPSWPLQWSDSNARLWMSDDEEYVIISTTNSSRYITVCKWNKITLTIDRVINNGWVCSYSPAIHYGISPWESLWITNRVFIVRDGMYYRITDDEQIVQEPFFNMKLAASTTDNNPDIGMNLRYAESVRFASFRLPEKYQTDQVERILFTAHSQNTQGQDTCGSFGILHITKDYKPYSVKFNTPPEEGSQITASYTVRGLPKDTHHILDVGFSIVFGEGSARSEKDVIAFTVDNQVGETVINIVNHTITAVVEQGASLGYLTAYFVLSEFAIAKVNNVLQVSGFSKVNFGSPVVYRVYAQNGTFQDWTVTVTMQP